MPAHIGARRAMNLGAITSGAGGGVTPPALAISSAYPVLKAAYTAGQAARLAMLGDSLTAAWGGGTASAQGKNIVGAHATAIPAKLIGLLNAGGLKAVDAYIQPDNGISSGWSSGNSEASVSFSNNVDYDPRIGQVGGSVWTPRGSANGYTAGGWMYIANPAVVGNNLIHAPGFAWDKVDVWYPQISSGGSISLTTSGGQTLAASLSQAGSNTLVKTTYTKTGGPSNDALSINPLSTAGVNFIMARFYDSTAGARIEIGNFGNVGTKAGDWLDTTNPWSPKNMLASIGAEMFTIMLGANDATAGVSAATFSANMQALITAAKAGGKDVQLIIPPKRKSGADVSGYLTAYADLSTSNGLPAPIDLYNGLSLVTADYFDDVHLAASGYAKAAAYIFARLAA